MLEPCDNPALFEERCPYCGTAPCVGDDCPQWWDEDPDDDWGWRERYDRYDYVYDDEDVEEEYP